MLESKLDGYIEFAALIALLVSWKRLTERYYRNHPESKYSEWPWWVKLNFHIERAEDNHEQEAPFQSATSAASEGQIAESEVGTESQSATSKRSENSRKSLSGERVEGEMTAEQWKAAHAEREKEAIEYAILIADMRERIHEAESREKGLREALQALLNSVLETVPFPYAEKGVKEAQELLSPAKEPHGAD